MYGLDFLLPLMFIAPMLATMVVVFSLRHLFYHRFFSPINGRALNEPGQSLRKRLDDALIRLYLEASLGPLVALTPIVFGMGRMVITDRQNWLEWAIYGFVSTLIVFVLGGMILATYQRIHRLKLGLACELSVADILRPLDGKGDGGFAVFNNLPTPQGSISAVVLTPAGVYSVVTKARTRPPHIDLGQPVVVEKEQLHFPHMREHQPIREARSMCRWLSQQLEVSLGEPIGVTGVVALPAWHVQGGQAGPDVRVLGGHQLLDVLGDLGATKHRLSETQHKALHTLLTRWTAGNVHFPSK
ncbi:nuclease-related domain-containing protein [Larsenimonas salina]|uniref:nuclease-related domain-containing protein n=1 Tax=Larsenimonas salina TaxID=1295565 RepID=UPI002074106A|nr:nuclease-related domain-containing protein [Larsenimonas salina]MCM5704618.1 NERD domain-containing protein [Larsenimonas salina]